MTTQWNILYLLIKANITHRRASNTATTKENSTVWRKLLLQAEEKRTIRKASPRSSALTHFTSYAKFTHTHECNLSLTFSQSRSHITSGFGSPTTSQTMTTVSPSTASLERGFIKNFGSFEYLRIQTSI